MGGVTVGEYTRDNRLGKSALSLLIVLCHHFNGPFDTHQSTRSALYNGVGHLCVPILAS